MKKWITLTLIISLIAMAAYFYQQPAVIQSEIESNNSKKLSHPQTVSKSTNVVEPKLATVEQKTPKLDKKNCFDTPESQQAWDKIYKSAEDYLTRSKLPETEQMMAIVGSIKYSDTNDLSKEERQKQRKVQINLRFNELIKASREYPDNKLLNFHLMDLCSAMPTDNQCTKRNIEQAIALDGSNGALWAEIASIYIAQGETDAAINALEQAIAAPIFDSYKNVRVSFFYNTLRQSGLNQYEARIITMGYEAAVANYGLQQISTFCFRKLKYRTDITYACLDYGKRLEQDGTTLLSNMMGLEYQRAAYKKLGNKALAAIIFKNREQLREQFTNAAQSNWSMFNNKDYQDYWFEVIQTYNEMDALELLQKEQLRLKSDPNFQPCSTNPSSS